ncbi:hypothetical protein SEPCBS57363_000056 [Sporothrix epigloea]|uniref:Uncharacterized protein n=1 Tax=Sporothrix epigloea TaxID=1892477 RepID=A0ABP0D579_9PEZI
MPGHLSEHLTTAPAPKQTVKSLSIGVSAGAAVATTDSSSSSSSKSYTKETTGAGAVSGVSAGVEGAIFACVIIVVLLVAGIVFFCIRQRRKSMPGQAIQHKKGDDRGDKASLSRHRSLHATKGSGRIGPMNRLRHQSQMLIYPGTSQSTADDDFPTPLISSANSCSSVRGVSMSTAGTSSKSASPQKGGSSYYHASLQKTCPPLDNSPRVSWLRRILNFFSSLKRRERSASPPLTSLSPPPSPTQMSARGRRHMDHDLESDGGSGIVDKNGNRVSAATSGSSYYGYYGYNGHFIPYYFPSSPICAPTTNKLEPRRERTPRVRPSKQPESQQESSAQRQQQRRDCHSSFNSQTGDDGSSVMPMPPLPTLPISIFSSRGLGSRNMDTSVGHRNPPLSYGKAVTTDAIVAPMAPLPAKKPITFTSPASPVRPKRPHESPLEITNLVMPYPPLPLLFRAKLVNNVNDRSFSMPGRTDSTSSAGRTTADMKNERHKPPVAYWMDTHHGAIVEGAKTESVSAGPRVPPPVCELPRSIRPPAPPVSQPTAAPRWAAEARGDRSSTTTESLDLPPLLMRDDDDDEEYGEHGELYRTQSTSSRSSSTIATITSGDRASAIAIGPFAKLPATMTAPSPTQRPSYYGPRSSRLSVQTVWPIATAPCYDDRTKTTFI